MVDVLAVRGLGLLGLNHSLLLGAVADGARDAPLRLRVLLLDPDSAAARQRAVEFGESPESFASGIRFTIARLREVAERGAANLEVACYDHCPSGGSSASTRPCTSARLPRRGRATSRRCTSSPGRRRGCCSAGCAGRSKTCASTPSGSSDHL
jgi:hypothetical protein